MLKSQILYIILYKYPKGSILFATKIYRYKFLKFFTFPAAIGAGPGVAGVEVTRLRA